MSIYVAHVISRPDRRGACVAGAVPTQFKATQLVVAIAVWANAISARGAHPNLSILLLNNASEQYYITIG